jgi:hypothetical protein
MAHLCLPQTLIERGKYEIYIESLEETDCYEVILKTRYGKGI